MGHAEVNRADAELGSSSSDRTRDLERRFALIIGEHLGVQPRQTVRCTQRLGQGFLRGESSGFRRHRTFGFGGGEDPPDETWPTFYRLGEPIDVADVDTNSNDHETPDFIGTLLARFEL
jgi:hypothetical protein